VWRVTRGLDGEYGHRCVGLCKHVRRRERECGWERRERGFRDGGYLGGDRRLKWGRKGSVRVGIGRDRGVERGKSCKIYFGKGGIEKGQGGTKIGKHEAKRGKRRKRYEKK